jgi:hypothetical protein
MFIGEAELGDCTAEALEGAEKIVSLHKLSVNSVSV